MSIDTSNIQEQICRLKHTVNKNCPDIMERFNEVEARVAEDIRTIEYSKKKGKYEGSKKDKEDGFIHFSDKEQLKGTLKKFFFNRVP